MLQTLCDREYAKNWAERQHREHSSSAPLTWRNNNNTQPKQRTPQKCGNEIEDEILEAREH